MKFAERVLIMLCLIGYYLAVWRRPPDMSIIFVGGGLLSVLYVCCMPFLLAEHTLKSVFKKQGLRRSWHQWLTGFLFGILSAYCVFSLIYHNLHEMDSLALAENCGIFLIAFTGLAVWQIKRPNDNILYKNILRRSIVLIVIISISLLVRMK